jgi:hypothetical protein
VKLIAPIPPGQALCTGKSPLSCKVTSGSSAVLTDQSRPCPVLASAKKAQGGHAWLLSCPLTRNLEGSRLVVSKHKPHFGRRAGLFSIQTSSPLSGAPLPLPLRLSIRPSIPSEIQISVAPGASLFFYQGFPGSRHRFCLPFIFNPGTNLSPRNLKAASRSGPLFVPTYRVQSTEYTHCYTQFPSLGQAGKTRTPFRLQHSTTQPTAQTQ